MKRESFLVSSLFAALWLAAPVGAQMAGSPGGQMGPTGPSAGQRQPNSPVTRPDIYGNNPASATNYNDDKRFAKGAELAAMTDLEMAKLAQQKASSDAVRQYAAKMMGEGSKTSDDLKQAAEKSSIAVPDSLDSKHSERVDKLSKLSGPEFDRAYLKDQVKDQEAEVREFQREADNGADQNMKQFASKNLAAVQQRLDAVKELNKSGAM